MMEQNSRRTKIIATLGPSSWNYETIKNMVLEGVDVFRINFSHGDHSIHQKTINTIREIEKGLGVDIPIIGDLQGPKIRTQGIPEEGIELVENEAVHILPINITPYTSLKKYFYIDYPNLHKEVKPGENILLDDGLIRLKVEEVRGEEIIARVEVGGTLFNRKGVNLPDTSLSIPSLTEKDKQDLEFAIENDLDFIALSFVRRSEDIKFLRSLMLEKKKYIPIIAKIEKKEALKNFEEIANESDFILVARGDLGVEVKLEKVALIQKEIIKHSNRIGKPVIVATQMLESMTYNPTPTRAEVADITNAILDGADALMVTGETARGKYPVEVIKELVKVIGDTEDSRIYRYILDKSYESEGEEISEAVGFAAGHIARKIKANAIVTFTETGFTARLIAKYRPSIKIIGVTPNRKTLRKMKLIWGVYPFLIERVNTIDEMLETVETLLKRLNIKGRVVITAGFPFSIPGTTNFIRILEIMN